MRAANVAWLVLAGLPWPILTAIGWLMMAGSAVVPVMPNLCLSVTGFGDQVATRAGATFASADPLHIAAAWLAMLVAMMPPLVSVSFMHVWHQTLRHRRWHAVGLFFSAYLSVWMVAGALLIPIAVLLQALAFELGVEPFMIALLLALAWQTTPWKQFFLNRCHNRPSLAAFGFEAIWDDLRFGLRHASSCVGACWAFMLCALVGSGLFQWTIMGLAMGVALLERTRAPRRPRWFAALGRLSPGARHLGSPLGRGVS